MGLVDLNVELAGLPKTGKLYLEDSYLKCCESRVLKVIRDRGSRAYVVLDRSVFHPRGGGQPSDVGVIRCGSLVFMVRKVLNVNGVLAHYGKFVDGQFAENCLVQCEVDWGFRFKVMKLHTTGHILDYALRVVYGEVVDTLAAFHGPPKAYTIYAARVPSNNEVKLIEKIANEIVSENRPVKIIFVNRDELLRITFNAPNLGRLPKSDLYRVVVIEGVNGIPCTGTHIRMTGEIERIKIVDVEEVEGGFKLYYDVS
ncbi:MAG: alanine--tRNA ligase-related protein [archaeon GB-1867-005]|nr:alanine--tRNA ligase-related protein [Candidatus Culexmicrobium cathedralense]